MAMQGYQAECSEATAPSFLLSLSLAALPSDKDPGKNLDCNTCGQANLGAFFTILNSSDVSKR